MSCRVLSDLEKARSPVSNHLTLLSPARNPYSHLPSLDPGHRHLGPQRPGLYPSSTSQPRQAGYDTEGGGGALRRRPVLLPHLPPWLQDAKRAEGQRADDPESRCGREGQRRAHLMLSSGLVLWTCTSHMGQYLLVSR